MHAQWAVRCLLAPYILAGTGNPRRMGARDFADKYSFVGCRPFQTPHSRGSRFWSRPPCSCYCMSQLGLIELSCRGRKHIPVSKDTRWPPRLRPHLALLWRGSETRGKRVAHLGVGFFYKVREVHFFFLSLRSFLAEGSAMNLWLLLQLVTWHAKRFAEKLNKQPPRTGHKKAWWRGVMGGAGMWERIHQTGAWWGGNRLFKQTLKLMVTFLFPENSPSFMNFRISKTIKHDNFQNTGRYV